MPKQCPIPHLRISSLKIEVMVDLPPTNPLPGWPSSSHVLAVVIRMSTSTDPLFCTVVLLTELASQMSNCVCVEAYRATVIMLAAH